MANRVGRRTFIQTSMAASAGAANLKAKSGRSEEDFPSGRIGDVKISRLICGSNPFAGGAHSRDLIYVGRLLKEYNTQEKVFDTIELCEQRGINTMIDSGSLAMKYRRARGGEIQTLAMVMLEGDSIETGENLIEETRRAIDRGAVGAFIRGCEADRWVRANKLELIDDFLSLVRANGLLAGIGAHDKRVPITCEGAGLKPDFHFKTFHHDRYYSALPKEKRRPFLVDSWEEDDHDCIWEQYPEDTMAYMRTTTVPWIGFKVLAAGAIHPREGFRYAFQNGADFLAVGMLDFWVKENVQIAREILADPDIRERDRPWA